MNRRLAILLAATVCALTLTTGAQAQVPTGTPPFMSFGGGPDVINLGNLNAHYSMPVFSRAGRGMPFYYGLAYDSSVWYPSGGTWQPANLTWGLTRDVPAAVGEAIYQWVQGKCQYNGNWEYYDVYNFTYYVDVDGSLHSFPKTTVNDNSGDCGPYLPTATTAINDGSGMTITVTGDPSATVTLKSGKKINATVGGSSAPTSGGNSQDSNGNETTTTISQGTTKFFDTLDAATPVLSISGTIPTVNYTYTPPSGTNVSVIVSYRQYTVQTNFGCTSVTNYPATSNYLVDRITYPDGTYYAFSYEVTPSHSPNVTARIASITLPTGGIISYTYSGGDAGTGIFCADGSTAGLTRQTPDGQWTYTRNASSQTTTVTDPKGNVTTFTFSGNYETNRVIKQAGTTELETVQTCYVTCGAAANPPFTQIYTIRSVGGTNSSESLRYYDSYGQPTYDYEYGWGGNWTLLWEKTISYDSTLGNNIVNRPSQILIRDGAAHTKSQTNFTYDEATPQSSGITVQHTGVTCNPGYTKCRGNPTTITYSTSGSTTLKRTYVYYDTGTVQSATDVNGAVTTYTYGTQSCGNVPNGAFVTNVALPIGSMTRKMTWDCYGAVILTSTDENSAVTTTKYTDSDFWRPSTFTDKMGVVTNLSYTAAIQVEAAMPFNGVPANSIVDIVTTLDSLGRPKFVQQRQAPWPATTFDSIEHDYDSSGFLFRTYVPYPAVATGSAPNGTPGAYAITFDGLGRPTFNETGGTSGPQITTSYPNLNDVYQSVGPAPTNENAKRRQFEYDAIGRLTSVCEITTGTGSGTCGQVSSQTGYWTTYAYDSPTNSMKVTQNAQASSGQQTRTYQYDMLGRLTSETNPESGTTTYVYDTDSSCGNTSNGDLIKRSDAVGSVTCYKYDAMHRLTDITYSGGYAGSTDPKHFVYDSAIINTSPNPTTMANAKGRLAEAYTGTSGSKITDLGFSYYANGRIGDYYESTPHSSGYYTLCSPYWENGALKSLNCLPGIPYLQFGAGGTNLDGEGRPTKISSQSGTNPITNVTYYNGTAGQAPTQPMGAVTAVTYGSNDSDSLTYSPATNLLTNYTFNVASKAVTGALTWNGNATLQTLQITDPLNSSDAQTCGYGYDDLARIANVNCGTSIWNQSFAPYLGQGNGKDYGAHYDAFGNVMKAIPPGSTGTSFLPTYSSSTNRFATLPGFTPQYDADGNLQADGTYTYAWNSDGEPASISNGATTITPKYDALGRVVEQYNGSAYTQIVYGPTGKLGLFNGQNLVKAFVPLPGGGTAVYVPGQAPAYYRRNDWLGSSRLATTSGQANYYDVAFAPFGENYNGSGTVDLNFAGLNQDTLSGLYDALFRKYNPVEGRWISPDPAGLSAVNMSNPQSWNRYAYVNNNPTGAVDPTGLRDWDVYDDFGGAGICIEGPWSCAGYPTYYVNGIAVPSSVGAALENSGFAVNCPQCGPGDRVLSDNSYGSFQFGKVGSWQFDVGTVPGNDDPTILDVPLFTYYFKFKGTILDYFSLSPTINGFLIGREGSGDGPGNAPSRSTMAQAVHTACVINALESNNGGGGGITNPTLPSSPDAIAPAYGPNITLYSQRIGQEPFNSKYEGSVQLTEPQGDFALLPPGAYVDSSVRRCKAAYGF